MNPGFQAPHFTLGSVVFTAIGATVFWGTKGRTKLKVYGLSWLFDAFNVPVNGWRQLGEFTIFLIIGCVVGIAIANPVNAAQAITAGFAWTSAFARRA